MRAIGVSLYQNTGDGALGASAVLDAKLAGLGELSWALDQTLTRLEPGTFTAKVWDPDGAVWTFLQDQIRSGAGTALLPPWVVLTVDGAVRFLGVVDLAGLTRDLKTNVVQLSAQDWSVLLRNKALQDPPGTDPSLVRWSRRQPRVLSTRTQVGPYAGSGVLLFSIGDDVVIFAAPFDVQVGDWMTSDHTSTTTFKVTSIQAFGSAMGLRLAGWSWKALAPTGTVTSASFYRQLSGLTGQPFYSVTADVTPDPANPVYVVPVDTVDRLYPGDVLETPSGSPLTVADVDPERLEVVLADPLDQALQDGDALTLSADSKAQLVFMDAVEVLREAAQPYAIDVSRFTPPTLPRRVLAWLPLSNGSGDDIRQASDLEATTTALRILGAGGTWTGTPEAGYTFTASAAPLRYVDWTSQLQTPPASLMPDETVALEDGPRLRNRSYAEWKTRYPRLVSQTTGSGWSVLDDPTYDPPDRTSRSVVVAHDVAVGRRYVLSSAIVGAPSVTWQGWTGSAWTTVFPIGGHGIAHPVVSAAPMIGVPAVGFSPAGWALVALTCAAGTYRLELGFTGSAVSVVVDAVVARAAVLRTTPWGTYLIGPGGYGRITYTGGVLALTWVPVLSGATCVLQPQTFTALDATTLFVFGRVDAADEQGKVRTYTYLFELDAAPNPADPRQRLGVAPWILNLEQVAQGFPRILTAVRDPSKPGRAVGICGSRLFQVSATLPRCIERFTAADLTASELVEHLAQVMNAVVTYRPDGTLVFVSREAAGAPVALQVSQAEVTQVRISKHFFSLVRATGARDDLYADAWGSVQGGRVLELQSHPMVWTEGQVAALALTYAAFFGRPRREERQTWFHPNAATAPPWEGLQPWASLIVNGGWAATFTAISEDLVTGTAKATLLEA